MQVAKNGDVMDFGGGAAVYQRAFLHWPDSMFTGEKKKNAIHLRLFGYALL
jgi:flavorubredoxin